MQQLFEYGKDHLTAGKALALAKGELKGFLSDEVRNKVQLSFESVVKIAAGQQAVYGINTGFGSLCDTRISQEKTVDLQRNLLLSHSVGVGDPISQQLTRLMLILKVHSLSQGFSGIAPWVIDRILWHLNQDVIPVVPEQGSVGASGDLAPLSHLFLPLIGEGQVFYQNQIRPTAAVLPNLGVTPLELHPKAGLALINGTQFILAHAVSLVDELHNCLAHADMIAAMMIEALQGSVMPFHQKLHEIRPYRGHLHVAGRVRQFLKNSEINTAHAHCDRVQDPYSLRCIPQVHGASRSAWLHLKEAVETELNSVTDNPIVFSDTFTVSGGNFHGQPLALPLDYACLAAAEIGSISDRRTYLSLEGKYGHVPKLLMLETGLHSGFMIVQYTAAALVSENKGLCFPASADSIPTSLGQEDHVSMGSIGGRKALRVCKNLVKILATELLCAAQAFDFQKPLRSGKTIEAIHACVRQHITHATQDRIFSEDIQRAIDLIESRKLLTIARDHQETAYSEFDELFETY